MIPGEGINAVGSSVFNASGGTISGALRGVFLSGANASVDNSGTISGASLAGLSLNDGGTLINRLGGVINTTGGNGVVAGLNASTIVNDGTIQGASNGVRFVAGGSLTNTGAISGETGVNASSSTQALNLVSSGSGSITGSGGTAITLGAMSDVVILQAGSTTSGSVLLGAGDDTLTVAGTITGAVDLGTGGDSFTLVSGGSVTGLIDGGAGTDAFILAGAGDASFNAAQAVNFETRVMNGTGTWTLTGTDVSPLRLEFQASALAGLRRWAFGSKIRAISL